MIIKSFSYTTGDHTITCDECGYTESDPTLPWLERWFNDHHASPEDH